MRQVMLNLLVVVAVCGLSACHHGHSWQAKSWKHYQPGDGAIDLAKDEVIIRAGGQPQDAQVGTDGSLKIGKQLIDTSADGRAALKRYNADATAFREHAVALGVAGANFGMQTAQHVLKGLFEGGADAASDEADAGAKLIEQRAHELCGYFRDAYAAQTDAAAAVPAFKPFAVISARQADRCDKQDSDDEPAGAKADNHA